MELKKSDDKIILEVPEVQQLKRLINNVNLTIRDLKCFIEGVNLADISIPLSLKMVIKSKIKEFRNDDWFNKIDE